jgi:hypothetical protein
MTRKTKTYAEDTNEALMAGVETFDELGQRAKSLPTRIWIERLLASFTGPFRFADLPAELRVHIYKLLLPHDQTIGFLPKTRWVWGFDAQWRAIRVPSKSAESWKTVGLDKWHRES